MDEQEWEIPPSSRYVSDSDSPLSLLPSPEIPSVPSSPIVSAANVMMSIMIPPSPYNQEFNSFRKIIEDDDGEEAEYRSVMYHEHIIATNDTIACVRPQSVSIQWPTTILPDNEDESESSSNEDTTPPTTCINDSIKIIIRNKSIINEKEETLISTMQDTTKAEEVIILIPPTENNENEVSKSYKKRKSSHVTNNKKKKKRTVTSYDSQTSLYLKSVFFEVYSKQSKLTKEQRIKVQEKTGLPSRNITYWFSNHKRRFQNTLKVYRKAVHDSGGAIKGYDDFINWRRGHDLPDQVTQEEVLGYQEKN